jgi:acetyl esterase
VAVSAKVQAIISSMEGAFPTPDESMSADELRAAVHAAAEGTIPADPEPIAHVEDRTVPGPGGDIPIRIYRPAGAPAVAPVVVFTHGGGFVLCDLDSHDDICRALANASDAVFVAVDYRLAPEHPFPAPTEDGYAVLRWVAESAAELGVDPARIGVVGGSAGGGLVAALALMARDRGGPRLGLQVLVYPMLDTRCDTPSHRGTGPGYFLKSEEVQWYWKRYLGDADPTDPYASPSHATDLSGLPPTLIVTAEHDPLRDEGEAYGAALAAAGVDVTVTRYDGVFHSFLSFLAVLDEALAARDQIGAEIRRRL